jgi:SET domain-containing protein
MKTAGHSATRFKQDSSRYRLRLGRSAIHRRGMFALEPIPGNRKVIEYAGERLSWQQTLRLLRKLWRLRCPRNVYLARLDRRCVIDGTVGGNGSQFINHCCDPNLGVRRIRGHLLFFSRRNIRAGEELTIDYRFRKYVPKTACRCGSPKCRGTINLK